MANSVSVELVEKMRFRVRTGSGHEIEIDASADVDGGDGGARPMELVLASLAGCAAMDVISILRKMRQDVSSYGVVARGEAAPEHPKKYVAIELVHRVRGRGIGEANVRRAIYLSMSRYCPVFAMIAPSVPVTVRYEISDDAGQRPGGGPVSSGEVRLEDAEPAGQRA
jgi:putative redox protein